MDRGGWRGYIEQAFATPLLKRSIAYCEHGEMKTLCRNRAFAGRFHELQVLSATRDGGNVCGVTIALGFAGRDFNSPEGRIVG